MRTSIPTVGDDRSLRQLLGKKDKKKSLLPLLFIVLVSGLFAEAGFIAYTLRDSGEASGRRYELEYSEPDFAIEEVSGNPDAEKDKNGDTAVFTRYGSISPVLVSLVPKHGRYKDVEDVFPSPLEGRLSSPFGWRKHPVTRRRDFHTGIDIAAKRGVPVVSVADGYVEFAGWAGNYGKLVVVNHADGMSTLYAHLDTMNVSKGSAVERGMRIGNVGRTGRTTGYHLHFETRADGVPVDPLTKISFVDGVFPEKY